MADIQSALDQRLNDNIDASSDEFRDEQKRPMLTAESDDNMEYEENEAL